MSNTSNTSEIFSLATKVEEHIIASASQLKARLDGNAQDAGAQSVLNRAWSNRRYIDSDQLYRAAEVATDDQQWSGRLQGSIDANRQGNDYNAKSILAAGQKYRNTASKNAIDDKARKRVSTLEQIKTNMSASDKPAKVKAAGSTLNAEPKFSSPMPGGMAA